MNQFDYQTDMMLFFGFRYSLGRTSVASSVCADFLIENWQRFMASTQECICEDIGQALETNQYGHEMDRANWQRVLDHAESTKETA